MRRLHRRVLTAGAAGLVTLAFLLVLLPGFRPDGGAGDGSESDARGGRSDAAAVHPVSPVSEPAPVLPRPDAEPRVVAVFADEAGPFSVAGIDPHAPRELLLWAVPDEGGEPRLVGRAHSEVDGSFVAEGLLLGLTESRIAVEPRDADPPVHAATPDGVPEAPALASLRSHSLAAIPASASAPAPGPVAWREGATLAVGLRDRSAVVWLADAAGVALARVEVPAGSRPGAVWRGEVADLDDAVWFGADAPAGEPRVWHSLATRSRAFPSSRLQEESP